MAAAEQPDEGGLFDFDTSARTWDTLYDASDFDSVAYYRPRLERTLAWVDSLWRATRSLESSSMLTSRADDYLALASTVGVTPCAQSWSY